MCHGERALFKNFVDRVLLLRDSDIEKFTLYFHVLHDAFLVNAWISAVVRHNVQELHISLFNFEGPFSLSDCLFTCEMLTRLNLDVPFLENLCLDECHWMNQTVVSISVPKLSCLNIHETERKRLTDLDGFQVTILGVSLIGFYYMGEFFNEYSLCNSSLLEEASIYACGFKKRPRKVVANRIYKLLKGFSNAKEIMISSYAVEALKYAAEFPRHMPMFNNLLNLELRQWSINLGSIALLKILQESPNLKTLEFSEVTSPALP
nr:F-box/LRR-repeat protein At1g52650-like [Quercus suber]